MQREEAWSNFEAKRGKWNFSAWNRICGSLGDFCYFFFPWDNKYWHRFKAHFCQGENKWKVIRDKNKNRDGESKWWDTHTKLLTQWLKVKLFFFFLCISFSRHRLPYITDLDINKWTALYFDIILPVITWLSEPLYTVLGRTVFVSMHFIYSDSICTHGTMYKLQSPDVSWMYPWILKIFFEINDSNYTLNIMWSVIFIKLFSSATVTMLNCFYLW